MGQRKGGAPSGSSNSFLPLQNKEGLLIHSTGRSMSGSCSCTHYLQAEASPDLWCGFVPGALQRAALWREALWAEMQLPVPCGTALTGCCSPKSLSRAIVTGARTAPAWASPVARLCCLPSSSSYLGFHVCQRDGASLSSCWVFPVCPCA